MARAASTGMLFLFMVDSSTRPPKNTVTTALLEWKRITASCLPHLALVTIALGGCDLSDQGPRAQNAASSAPVPPMTDALADHYTLIVKGHTGPARVRIRQLIDAGQGDARADFLMGLSHHRDRIYAKVVPWFERALAATPPYPPAAHFLGWAHYHAGNPQQSQQAFERHLQLDPEEGDSYFGLGVLALEDGRFDRADTFLSKAIELQRPVAARQAGVAKALARRSEILEHRGDLDAAIALLNEAIQLNANLYEAQFRQARILRRLGRAEEATRLEASAHEARARVEAGDERPR